MDKKNRKKSNKAPAGVVRVAMEALSDSWLTPEEWEAILESLPEIEVDVAPVDEPAAFGFRKIRDSRLSH